MTKSEMRRLQFQRKYTSNEDYEKDKDLAIAFCESTVIERTPAEIKQMKNIADLLKRSKWICAVDPAYDEGYRAGYIDGAKDWDD